MGYNIYDELCEESSDELENIIIFCKHILDERNNFHKEAEKNGE